MWSQWKQKAKRKIYYAGLIFTLTCVLGHDIDLQSSFWLDTLFDWHWAWTLIPPTPSQSSLSHPTRTAPPLLAVRKGWRHPLHPFLLNSQPFVTYLTPVKLSCNERRQKPNPPFLSLSKIKHVIICSYSQTCFISSKKILFHILL